MPYDVDPSEDCARCPHGYCVTYIREQSRRMKDRDTQYRLVQKSAIACGFDSWVPGFEPGHDPETPLSAYVDKLIENASSAGHWIEAHDPGHFGEVEESFFLTAGQRGKVTGDVLELLVRAVCWNVAAHLNSLLLGQESPLADAPILQDLVPPPGSVPKALLTLGDNYDLKELLDQNDRTKLQTYEDALKGADTSLAYPTPDLVAVEIDGSAPGVLDAFTAPVRNLGPGAQELLGGSRKFVEGTVKARKVAFAAGIKSSLRSDRMYQFLFEANAWKFLWRRVFEEDTSSYYVWVTRTYGADPGKLRSVDFTSVDADSDGQNAIKRAIEAVAPLITPTDLVSFVGDHW